MALTALKGKRIPKKAPRAKARAGVLGFPVDQGFEIFKWKFHETDRKEFTNAIKSFVKKNYSKLDAAAILSNPEYKFYTHSHYGAISYWLNSDLPMDDIATHYKSGLIKYLDELLVVGKQIVKEKKVEVKQTQNVVSLSPMQRLQNKINSTIMQDLLDLEDQWMDGEKTDINIYKLFQTHGLSGSATLPVRKVVKDWLLDYEDAYHKRDEQAVEGYSHLKRTELNRRIKSCQEMLLDLDKIQSATKASRKIKIPKSKSADKQVARVQYKKEDNDFKLVSINPILLVGARRLFVFNTKYKVIMEYCTQAANGFELSGSTIKNFDKVNSRSNALRKPNEFLPIVQSKTLKQIDTEWKKLTTKTSIPNGRINKDTILLRIMDK